MFPPSACRKTIICPRSGILKSIFCPSFAGAKNTSIRTTERTDGFAGSECGQCGCFGGKVPTGLFRRSLGGKLLFSPLAPFSSLLAFARLCPAPCKPFRKRLDLKLLSALARGSVPNPPASAARSRGGTRDNACPETHRTPPSGRGANNARTRARKPTAPPLAGTLTAAGLSKCARGCRNSFPTATTSP